MLVHDGVRPLINAQLITDNIACVKKNRSAITIVPAIETIAAIDENKKISSITDREKCFVARAPQSFYFTDILGAHKRAELEDNLCAMIDSAMLMAHYGYALYTVDGPIENIKVTTPADYYVCRALIEAKESLQIWG